MVLKGNCTWRYHLVLCIRSMFMGPGIVRYMKKWRFVGRLFLDPENSQKVTIFKPLFTLQYNLHHIPCKMDNLETILERTLSIYRTVAVYAHLPVIFSYIIPQGQLTQYRYINFPL